MTPDRPQPSLDDVMRNATGGLRHDLADLDAAPFAPSPRRTPIVATALVLALGVGGFALTTRGTSDTIVTEPATTVSSTTVASTTVSSTGGEPAGESTTTILDVAPGSPAIGDVLLPAPIDQPMPGETIVDPAFGSSITRLTASSDDEYIAPIADLTSVWNADESRLLLYRTTAEGAGEHRIYDVADGSFAVADITPSDIEEVAWNPVDPEVLVFVEGSALVTHDVTTGATTVIETFAECEGLVTAVGGNGISDDGDVVALACLATTGDSLLSYRFSTGEVIRVEREQSPELFTQAPQVAPSGTRFVFQTGDRTAEVLDENLQPTGLVIDALDTIGTDASGADIALGASFSGDLVGSVVTIDLDTGDGTVIVGPDTGAAFPPGGNSVSASGRFAAFSTEGIDDLTQWASLDNEVVVVDFSTDEPVVRRVAHNRTSNLIDYWSSPFVSVSPSGERVAFSSDWGTGTSVDTYIVELS